MLLSFVPDISSKIWRDASVKVLTSSGLLLEEIETGADRNAVRSSNPPWQLSPNNMKRTSTPKQRLAAAAAGLALAISAGSALAASDYVIQPFDADVTSAHDDGQWPDGSSSKTIVWSEVNAGTGAGSGSMKVTILWSETNQVAGWQDSKLGITAPGAGDFAWPGIDCRPFINIEFDVKVDVANSHLTPNGNYGGVEVIFQGWKDANGNPDGLGWTQIGSVAIDNTGEWQRKSLSIANYPYNVNKLVLNFNVNPGTNKITYLVDNITLTAPPVPPPTLSLDKPVPGLMMMATSAGQWDRQEIRTVGSNYSWIGRSGPVSYSVDVAKLGATAPPGFPLFFHFVPGVPDPARGDSDYHETNVVMFSVSTSADGSAWATLRYKTNAPDSNGHQFDTGDIGGLWNATPNGTWTVTFSENTNVTVTAPGGGTLVTNLPQEVIDIYAASANMQVNIGVMPGEFNRRDQMAVLTRARITGTAEPNLDSNFLGQAPDTNYWRTLASANAVQSIPTDAAYWVKWTLPANGFAFQTNATVNAQTWGEAPITGFNTALENHYTLFRQSELPSANSGYFRMLKEVATKLQILLPGEVNAPGTPTGKTGTPIQPENSMPYTFTVNAVDDNWKVVSKITDSIEITCSEVIALLPPNASLVGGTANFDITLFEAGTWTITATDVTDSSKAPVTVTVTVQ